MTPEEYPSSKDGPAWEPIDRWRSNGHGRLLSAEALADLQMRVNGCIKTAILEEREACAKAIRVRGEK